MTIFINTFRNLLRLKFTLFYIILMSIIPVVISFVLKSEFYEKNYSLQSQLDFTVGIYYILIFMWVIGIPFFILASAKGIGIIGNEITEGTLGLLVSMKTSRYQIVLYKWLALYVVILLLGISAIIGNLTILGLLSGMNEAIFNQLTKSLFFIIEYLLIMDFIFSSLAILLSIIIHSKIFATISMTFYVVVTFLIIPLFKNFLTSYYEKYHLFYYDMNYHFSLIYYYFISRSHINISPVLQNVMGTFIGVFDIKRISDQDMSLLLNGHYIQNAQILYYLSPNVVLIIWGFIGLLAILLSMFILTKKDIV